MVNLQRIKNKNSGLLSKIAFSIANITSKKEGRKKFGLLTEKYCRIITSDHCEVRYSTQSRRKSFCSGIPSRSRFQTNSLENFQFLFYAIACSSLSFVFESLEFVYASVVRVGKKYFCIYRKEMRLSNNQ